MNGTVDLNMIVLTQTADSGCDWRIIYLINLLFGVCTLYSLCKCLLSEISRNGKNGLTIWKLFIQIKPNENLCARKWSISCTVKPTCDKFTPVFFDRLIVNLSKVSKTSYLICLRSNVQAIYQ